MSTTDGHPQHPCRSMLIMVMAVFGGLLGGAILLLAAYGAIAGPAWGDLAGSDPAEIRAATVITGAWATGLGLILLLIGTVISIRRIDRSARRIEEHERRFRTIFDSAGDAFIIHDLQGRIIEANPQAVAIFGLTRDELVTLTLSRIAVGVDPFEERMQILREVGHLTFETTLRSSNGRRFPTEVTARTLEFEGIPAILNIVRDTTEREWARRELEVRTTLAQIFLGSTGDSVYRQLLELVVEATESVYGMVGYIDADNAFVRSAITRTDGDEREICDDQLVIPRDTWSDTTWQRAIRTQQLLYDNHSSETTPEGHLSITRNIAVPVVFRDQVIGLFQVANKTTPYVAEDLRLAHLIADHLAPVLGARLESDGEERRRVLAELALREHRDRLDELVRERTSELTQTNDRLARESGERREAQERLQRSEASLARAQSIAHIGSWHYDLVTGELTWSDELCRLLGLDVRTSEPCLEAVTARIHDDDRASVLATMDEAIAGHALVDAELRIVQPDGHERIARVRGNTILDDTGVPRVFAGTLEDITERRELESRLHQSQKLESIGTLAGGVAHDFNNLLMGIMNYVELCRDELDPDHPVHEWLDEITGEAQRSANLTRQLLAFARKQTIAPRILDLNDMVTRMLKLLRRLIGEDIDLLWMPGADLWQAKLDPSQVDQILANLCVNARDAIDGVGKITIETQNVTLDADYCATHTEAVPGPYVMLAVSDTGCGMDRETLARIYDPFFTTKGLGEGTGLGLATVHGIVRQNSGHINVYSEPGQSTTFRVYLPRYAGEAAAAVEEDVPEERPGGRETILLVEDEKSLRVTCRMFLEALGYQVVAAAAPEHALHLAAEHAGGLHLLITDVIMPGMSGNDLADVLTERYPQVKCLFMSGYTANVIAERGILEDGIDFLPKPFTRDTLARKVREILDRPD